MPFGITKFHPAVLMVTLIAGVLILRLKRKSAILPFIFAGILIPTSQRIIIFDLDFNMLRILILFGWMRIILRSEWKSIQFNAIDKAIFCFIISRFVIYVYLRQNFGALKLILGVSYDTIGIYFLARSLIRDFEDLTRIIKTFAITCLVLGILIQIEFITGRIHFIPMEECMK
jgi:hypothetical protein